MASTDARPIPKKNTAYRVTFPLIDADGDLVTGATGLDSEVSIDGGTFTDCTSEATEIATASGIYYLDLTSAEMNGDTIAIIVKTSSSGAKTTPIVLYPEESGDLRVTVNALDNNAITAASIATDAIDNDALAANAVSEIQSGLATAAALTTVSGYIDTEVAAIKAKTDALPADPADASDITALVDALPTAAEVWAYATRTLTSAGSGGATADEVWAYTTRTLTSGGGGATANEIADAVLSRGVSNVQDTADTTSLAALILATFESSIVGTSWVIRKTGGTTFTTKTVTIDADADPITGVN